MLVRLAKFVSYMIAMPVCFLITLFTFVEIVVTMILLPFKIAAKIIIGQEE